MSEPAAAADGEAEDVITAPVSLKSHDDGQVSLTFGPMSVEDLAITLQQLGTEEGNREFVDTLIRALKEKKAEVGGNEQV